MRKHCRETRRGEAAKAIFGLPGLLDSTAPKARTLLAPLGIYLSSTAERACKVF